MTRQRKEKEAITEEDNDEKFVGPSVLEIYKWECIYFPGFSEWMFAVKEGNC